jgi:hypothetical protein
MQHNDPFLSCLVDMIARPGKYTGTKSDTTPFEFKVVHLFQGGMRLNLNTAFDVELLAATFASLIFDMHKDSSVRGEVIGNAHSGNLNLPKLITPQNHCQTYYVLISATVMPHKHFNLNPLHSKWQKIYQTH